MQIKKIFPQQFGLLFAAFAFSQGIGLLGFWALPLVSGALMTGLGLSIVEVGMIGTAEGFGLFVSSLLLANYVGQGYRKRAAIISVTVVILGNCLCGIFKLDFTDLIVMRFMVGLGAGLALAVGNATIANARDAEKFSGHLTLMLVVFMVIVMPVLSRLSEGFGHQGVFFGLAVIVLIGTTSIVYMPDGPDKALTESAQSNSNVAVTLLSPLALSVLVIMLLFGARGTLPWLVAEQLGAEAGMSLLQVGDLFSAMYAVSILGPAALILLARVAKVRTILFWALAAAGFFNWLFTTSDGNATQFVIGIVVWSTLFYMAFAQINAIAALSDRTGRLASAVGSAFIGGVTIAPFVGGMLVDAGGYAWLGMAEVTLTLLIALIVLIGMPKEIK